MELDKFIKAENLVKQTKVLKEYELKLIETIDRAEDMEKTLLINQKFILVEIMFLLLN